MKRHWVRLQLRLEAPKDVKLEMLSRRAALSGNTSAIIATFLLYFSIALRNHFYHETCIFESLHNVIIS